MNPDKYAKTYETPAGANMYAYCLNNPVACIDSEGDFGNWLIGGLVGGLIGGISSAAQGDGFGAGFASGFTSGAIAGAGVDLAIGAVAAIATVATGGVAVLIAGGIAFLGGFIGSIAGEQVYSLCTERHMVEIDDAMVRRAAINGVINVAAFGISAGTRYAESGSAGFNHSPKIKDILRAAFKDSFKPVLADVVSTFWTVNFGTVSTITSAACK